MTSPSSNQAIGRQGASRACYAATYRLLPRLGSVVRQQPPAIGYLSKRAALAQAIAAVPHPGGGVRVWLYADAILLHGVWLCVLDDSRAVRIVEIHARTGDIQMTTTLLRRRSEYETSGARLAVWVPKTPSMGCDLPVLGYG